jgi:putative YphP/YqiW family bacilliredoxin
MYPEMMVAPMRAELTNVGFAELRSAAEVDAALKDAPGTTLVVVNSVCGCAARNCRPALAEAVQHSVKPDKLVTVFAGQDSDATRRAREYFTGYQPSSPSIGLLKDGQIVYMMERWQIEGRDSRTLAAELKGAFEQHCGATTV